MGGEAHANPGCRCGFMLLDYAQASPTERVLVQLGLSSLNWHPDPPTLRQLHQLEGSAVMSSQNAVC